MVSVAGLLVDSAAAGGSNILERIGRFLVCLFVFLGLVSVAGFFMVSVVAGKRLFMVSVVGFFYDFRRGKERFFMVSVVVVFLVSGCYRTVAFSPMETAKQIRTFP